MLLESDEPEETDWDHQLRHFHQRWKQDPEHKQRVGKQMLRLHKLVRGGQSDASSLSAMRLALLLDHEDMLGSSYSRLLRLHRRASSLFGCLQLPIHLPKLQLQLARPQLTSDSSPGSSKRSRLATATTAAQQLLPHPGCLATITAATPQHKATATPASVLSTVKSILPRLLTPFSRRSASPAPLQASGTSLAELAPVPFSLGPPNEDEPGSCAMDLADGIEASAEDRQMAHAEARSDAMQAISAAGNGDCPMADQPAATQRESSAGSGPDTHAAGTAGSRHACCTSSLPVMPALQPTEASCSAAVHDVFRPLCSSLAACSTQGLPQDLPFRPQPRRSARLASRSSASQDPELCSPAHSTSLHSRKSAGSRQKAPSCNAASKRALASICRRTCKRSKHV